MSKLDEVLRDMDHTGMCKVWWTDGECNCGIKWLGDVARAAGEWVRNHEATCACVICVELDKLVEDK